MIPVLFLLAACNPTACGQLGPVDPFNDGTSGDGGAAQDDSGDSGSVDTAPSSLCDVPEIEPNDPYDHAQDLPMEQWACGSFSDSEDSAEVFYFENAEVGWLRVWGRAFDLGSLADLTLSVSSTDAPYGASKTGNPDSSDTTLVFPVDGSYGFYATLSEAFGRYGDAYFWELMASDVKAPVDWNGEEADSTSSGSNDSSSTAEPVVDGDRIFGRMNTAADYDWYSLEVPDGRSDVVLDIDASFYGSPADVRIYLYKPDGSQFAMGSSSIQDGLSTRDPRMSVSLTVAGTWHIKVMPEIDSDGNTKGGGGTAFWYVLGVSVTDGG